MNINQLKYVLEVAASSSMREAATKLFVAQPAASASIHELRKIADIRTGAVAREMEVAKRLKEHYEEAISDITLIRVVLVVSQTVCRYNET